MTRRSGPRRPLRLYGRHAVVAALANPNRVKRRLHATREAANALHLSRSLPVEFGDGADLGRLIPDGAPHQGLVLDVEPLEEPWLGDILAGQTEEHIRPLIVLDQVTDPQNLGAILRSAAAFGALGILTQDRHAPPESGALARAASGALEIVPWVRVVNLARALDELAAAGYWRIGLDSIAPKKLSEVLDARRLAFILGAEGEGLRPNTKAHCDEMARLPISPSVESLNVSTAAAIALYAAATVDS